MYDVRQKYHQSFKVSSFLIGHFLNHRYSIVMRLVADLSFFGTLLLPLILLSSCILSTVGGLCLFNGQQLCGSNQVGGMLLFYLGLALGLASLVGIVLLVIYICKQIKFDVISTKCEKD